MKPGEDLQKKLRGLFEPSSLVSMRFKGKDVSFKTDEKGNPVLLFIGVRGADGTVRGKRYARTLKLDKEGTVIKDHWELKGKAS